MITKNVLAMVFCSVLLLGCVCSLSGEETDDEKAISNVLKANGIDVTSVKIGFDTIDVTYNQPTSESKEQIYAAWTYIFGVAVEKAPSSMSKTTLKVAVTCNYDNGESMKVTASADKITAFLNNAISTADFMASWKYDYLTKGPQMN